MQCIELYVTYQGGMLSIITLCIYVIYASWNYHYLFLSHLHLLISNEVWEDYAPASGLGHLVYQLPGPVGAGESPDVVAPDHTLGAGANNINLTISDNFNVSALLQKNS